jgi:hypothetical protein
MLKLIQRALITISAIILLSGLSGCYSQSLVTEKTKVSLPVAEKYQMIWEAAPKDPSESLLNTLFAVNKLADGSYSLEYKQRYKRERKILETLKLGDSLYIQLREGEAFELMRVELSGDEAVLFSELPGCAIKNGEGEDSEINMLRLDMQSCAPLLGISPAELDVSDGVGRILWRDGAAQAAAFLERYGSKMYAVKKYRLQVQK